MEIIAKKGKWLKIKTLKGQIGWIWGGYTKKEIQKLLEKYHFICEREITPTGKKLKDKYMSMNDILSLLKSFGIWY